MTYDALVPIAAQIAAAERELKYRLRVYPRWQERGKISAQEAAAQLAAMRAIVQTLQQVARGERLI
jgi:hypothetical protein